MGRTPVVEQVEQALRTVQQQTAAQISSGDFAGEPVYIENMLDGRSNFTSRTLGTIRWERHGFEESVQQVPPALLRDGAFRRRLASGKMRQLSGEAVDKRLAELEPLPDTANADLDRIHKALSEGASERNSRYAIEGLPDQGFERGQITPEQTWGSQPQTVRRSGTSPLAQPTDLSGPLPPEQVMGERVKEGEWQSDVG